MRWGGKVRALLLAIVMALQVPAPAEKTRVVPSPLPTAPWAEEVVKGLLLVDVRPDGVYLMGSACATGPFTAYTAHHVIAEAKGHLVAVPNFGFHFLPDMHAQSQVVVVRKDEKQDLAQLAVESPEDAFASWRPRGPIPLPGAEVRGVLVLPSNEGNGVLVVPSRGEMYGEQDDRLWSSHMSGPGSSGSCMLDDQNRVFAILVATSTWGKVSPGPRASVLVPLPPKD